MGFRWATTSTSLYCLCASARSCQPLIYLLSWPHWGLGCTEVSRAMSAPRFQTHLTLSHTALWADLDLCLGFCFSVDLKLLTLLWSGWWTSLKCYLVGGKRLAGGNISSSTSAEAWNQVKEQFDMAHHQIRRRTISTGGNLHKSAAAVQSGPGASCDVPALYIDTVDSAVSAFPLWLGWEWLGLSTYKAVCVCVCYSRCIIYYLFIKHLYTLVQGGTRCKNCNSVSVAKCFTTVGAVKCNSSVLCYMFYFVFEKKKV